MSTLSLRAKLGLRTACSVVLASTLVVGLGLASVRAQTVELPEISVYANQAPTDVGKVGAAVTVLRGADLRAQGYNNVPDALRTVPGVEVNQTGGRGSLTQVSRWRASSASRSFADRNRASTARTPTPA